MEKGSRLLYDSASLLSAMSMCPGDVKAKAKSVERMSDRGMTEGEQQRREAQTREERLAAESRTPGTDKRLWRKKPSAAGLRLWGKGAGQAD